MNYKKIVTASSAMALTVGLLAGYSNLVSAKDSTDDAASTVETKKSPAQVISSYNLMTKVAGTKNYKVWKNVVNGKVSGKVADAIVFRYNHIQSNQSIKTKKATYWLIYVDGRRVGWVNEKFFARNQIAVPKTVSLVRNSNYVFDASDAISYATDDTGTVVDNEDVDISKDVINCDKPKTYTVKYSLGKAKASTKITVRKSTKEGIANANAVTPKKGTTSLKSWDSHYGSSLNYISNKEYSPETDTHSWSSNGITMKTRLFQPVLLSVKTNSANEGEINRVGHIPEGVTVSHNWAFTSLLSYTSSIQGHIVGYDLSKLTDPFEPQHLLTMKQSKFNSYVQNIKVSPYVPIGHGQAMGSTKKYVYALVNNNDVDTNKSEELVQIRRSDMLINKIWTIKCWNGNDSDPRYFKNGVVVSDKQMYTLNYDEKRDCYEYWEFNRKGDNWYPTLVGATEGDFVGGTGPVQGFTYDSKNKNFYIAFNDIVVKVGRTGTYKGYYDFTTGREIEGISVDDGHLYFNLAQRAELLKSVQKLN
ncbi:SH3-like domain-containing protein [Lactobacillus sp. HT06-2]|uniref:SH3-like domain-containing protein n=1 Tax=Lactobacillus TaxID=1578 RepID=UPI0026BDD6F1